MNEVPVILGSWDGAQYIDRWMLVHLLAGIVFTYILRISGFSFFSTAITVLVVLVGWEIYEEMAHIPEPLVNTIIDLLVGAIGIFIGYWILPIFGTKGSWTLALFLLIVYCSLGISGWLSWRAGEEAMKTNSQKEVGKVTDIGAKDI